MKLAYAFTANAAEYSPDGKLWVLGGDYDILRSDEFPIVQPALALVVKILARPEECEREYRIQIRFFGPAGVIPVAEASVDAIPRRRLDLPDQEVGIGFVLNYQQVTFPRPGRYSFVITNGDEELGIVNLFALAGDTSAGTIEVGEENA